MTRAVLSHRLSALDNAFLAVESANAPTHVGCLAIYEVEASLGDRPTHIVTEALTRVVADVPALCRRLWPSLPRGARWDAYWDAVRPVELTPTLERHAGQLARTHALRGADAV